MKRIYLYILIIIKNILSGPICQESKKYCKKCNPLTNICSVCELKDILVPDNNGGCKGTKRCIPGKNFCMECDENGELCQTCEVSYFADNNGGCSNTLYCNLSYKGECFECEDNFILTGETNFKICKYAFSNEFKNCKKIDYLKGRCESCDENYFLTKGDKTCTKTEFCYETIFGNCILCIEGFYLNKKEEKCYYKTDTIFTFCQKTLDGKYCDICDDGFYFDENRNCVDSNFCSESLNAYCKKCKEGYYLAKNDCCSNIENCYNADKDTGICSLCMDKYYLDVHDYKCYSNLENNEYKYCSIVENNMCIKCISGYFLSKDNKCTFTNNCEEAKNGKCILCSENYYLGLDSYCSNIKHCIYTSYNGYCRECEDNYYFSGRFGACLEYENNTIFYNCKYTNFFDDYCIECKDNFYYNYNQSLCLDNNQEGPFYKCAYSDDYGENCDVCIEEYYLGIEDKKCSLIENCKISENENKCIECDEYYCLDVKNQKCIDNDYLEDINILIYFACKETNENGTACEKCIDGYQVNEEGFCFDVENCEEKEDGKCLKCKDKVEFNGYNIYYCANDIFGCVQTSHQNCLKCNNLQLIYYCTECYDGYKLNSYGDCIKENKE